MSLAIRSNDLSTELSLTSDWISINTNKQYFQCAIVTLLVYDIFITMDREVKYFWGTRFSDVKLVYFTNRYIGVIGASAYLFCTVSQVPALETGLLIYFYSELLWSKFCRVPEHALPEHPRLTGKHDPGSFSAWMQDIANWLTIVLIDYILMIRVLALYEREKKLSLILKAFLAVEACLKLCLFIFFDVTAGYIVAELPTGVTVCGQENYLSVALGLVDWIIPMIYNLVLMVLAVYKAAEYWKMSIGFKGFELVKVVIKDQIIYFVLIVACCIVDILQFKVQVASLFWTGVLGSLGNPAFLCILGTRMLFNLKEAGELGVNKGTSYRVPSSTISTMDFS